MQVISCSLLIVPAINVRIVRKQHSTYQARTFGQRDKPTEANYLATKASVSLLFLSQALSTPIVFPVNFPVNTVNRTRTVLTNLSGHSKIATRLGTYSFRQAISRPMSTVRFNRPPANPGIHLGTPTRIETQGFNPATEQRCRSVQILILRRVLARRFNRIVSSSTPTVNFSRRHSESITF